MSTRGESATMHGIDEPAALSAAPSGGYPISRLGCAVTEDGERHRQSHDS